MQIDMGVSHRKAARDIARVPCSCTGMVAGVSDIVPVGGNRGLRGVSVGCRGSGSIGIVRCSACCVRLCGLRRRLVGVDGAVVRGEGIGWVSVGCRGLGCAGSAGCSACCTGCGGCRGICGSLGVPADGNRGLRGYRLIPGGGDGHWPAAGMRFVALHTNVLHWEVCPSHRRKH